MPNSWAISLSIFGTVEGKLALAWIVQKLTLCSQDAFMQSYLTNQRKNIFSDVAVMIYVFDIESREVASDLDNYSDIIAALKEFSPDAYVFCLIHKMDIIQPEVQERIAEERAGLIRERSHGLKVDTFASSIWNQSLYRAWAGIVHKLIPNLSGIERFLEAFAEQISAEEIILFERSTFLTVTSVVTDRGKGNPFLDRHERISNIFKTFKHSIAKNTKTSPAAAGFVLWKLQTRQFNIFLQPFTDNTYIFVVLPPGEAAFNCAVYNTASARDSLKRHVELAEGGGNSVTAGPNSTSR